jgi:hypothetical protein
MNINSLNVSSFTFHSYEIENTSYYEPLTTEESFSYSFVNKFSPMKTSSPKQQSDKSANSSNNSAINNSTKNHSNIYLKLPKKKNLRILTVNCRSIKDKTSEFKAILNYTKPDIVIGTESWLKGIQPGKNPTKDAIKTSEIFPDQYQAFRNDRGTLGGGVFVLVHNSIVATEQPQYVTNCEINWVKIKLQNTKNLLIGSFFIPHRNKNTLEELEKSLQLITNDNNNNMILAGDFNCPDIS